MLSDYVPMFDNPALIEKKPLYFFEKRLSNKVSGYNVFVKHKFLHMKILELKMITSNATVITIDSDLEDCDDNDKHLKFKKVVREWMNLNHIHKQA